MAVYKVPQDVEAEDKLIGPFSFRQFIYLIVAAMTIGLEWALAQVFIGLILIPLPLTILFIVIALPLRKDQPMELWLAAVVRFFIKPRLKMWWPEGEINLVSIVAPREVEKKLAKDLTPEEARQRFTELAEIIDTQGWSLRGIKDYTTLGAYGRIQDTTLAESSMIPDVMDETQGIGLQFNNMIEEQELAQRQQAQRQIQDAIDQSNSRDIPSQASVTQTTPVPNQGTTHLPSQPQPPTEAQTPAGQAETGEQAIPQTHTQEVNKSAGSSPPPTTSQVSATNNSNTSNMPIRADILELANNNTMSISSIAKEIHRIEDKGDEVVLNIRH